jgi:ribonuclease Z
MSQFDVYILGCGSALPTRHHLPASQIVDIRGKLFMIDCGEGTQLQFRNTKLNYNKIYDIFISHLHGDHCFGLIGLISTMGMLGRNAKLTIHAPENLEGLLRPQLDFFCKELPYEVKIISFNTSSSEIIYEDKSLEVLTIPLKHRIPSAGFLFREKPKELHVIKEMLDFHKVPVRDIQLIKKGLDFVKPDGEIIPNSLLTNSATPSKSYAYCSDTAYTESVIPYIKGIDLLYHEATFCELEKDRAKSTMHSTAAQAGKIARLANVKRLLIGHYSARYLNDKMFLKEAKTEFENVLLADENQKIEV